MPKKHLVEFNDESAQATGKKNDALSMSFSGDELVGKFEVNGIPFISGNGSGLVKLGELLIQLGLSQYRSGFHLHIHKNFDDEKSEILIVGLDRPA
jgi:hypothetical protein